MNIEVKDIILLDDNNQYIVVSKINYENKNYYYIVDKNNNENLKFCYEDEQDLVELKNDELATKLLSLFCNDVKDMISNN